MAAADAEERELLLGFVERLLGGHFPFFENFGVDILHEQSAVDLLDHALRQGLAHRLVELEDAQVLFLHQVLKRIVSIAGGDDGFDKAPVEAFARFSRSTFCVTAITEPKAEMGSPAQAASKASASVSPVA